MILTDTFWIVDAVRIMLVIVIGGIIGGTYFNDYKAFIAIQAFLYLVSCVFFQYFLTLFGA